MKTTLQWIFLVLLTPSLVSTACGGGSSSESASLTESSEEADGALTERYAYVWPSQVSLLESPDPAGAEVAAVPQASRVIILPRMQAQRTPVVIGDRLFPTNWQEVRLLSGESGWIPSAAVRSIPVRETDEAPSLSFDLGLAGENVFVGGFGTDRRVIVAGGRTSLRSIALGSCSGYANEAPTLEFQYVQPAGHLRVFLSSLDDTVLAIQLPDGQFLCRDDDVGANPMVVLESPQEGQYRVWAGSYNAGSAQAELVVTEDRQLYPGG